VRLSTFSLCALFPVFILCTERQFAHGSEVLGPTPFIGETVQQFEARKRGLQSGKGSASGGVLTIVADDRGHFFVEPSFGPQRIRMLVDTGASVVALSHEDAQRMSLSIASGEYTEQVATANGIVQAAAVTIPEVQLDNIIVRDVDAVVLPPGRLMTSLLGMSFLGRLSTFEMSNGRLVLGQ
jgi:aspartyl protease family protein